MISTMLIKPTLLAFLIWASSVPQPASDVLPPDRLGTSPFRSLAYVETHYEQVESVVTDEVVIDWGASDYDDFIFLLQETATEYGLDPILCVAISRLETGNFTSQAFSEGNNWGGITEGGINSYPTKEDGLIAFMKCLCWYRDSGMTTPESMAQVYCPDNPEWAQLVREIMIEKRR